MCLLFMDILDTSDTIDLDYMVEKLGIEKSKIDDLSNLLYKNYGTTMAGLRVWLSFSMLSTPCSKLELTVEFRNLW